MRIAFDAKRLYNNFTGLGNYSRQLVSDLTQHFPEHEYHLFTPKIKYNSETEPLLNHLQLQTHQPNGSISALWRSSGIKKDLQAHNIQVYHGLSHEIPVGLHRTNIKSVVSIHDLVIKRHPEYFPWLDRQIYDWKFRYACEHADHVVAISESTKRDIIEYYQIDPQKISVIYQTCHPRFKQALNQETLSHIRAKYQLPEQFLLYVGSIIPRKNLLKLVESLSLLPKNIQLPLIVVGNGKKYKQQVEQRIQALNLTKLVHFIRPEYDDLPAFYQLAEMLIYPSTYEGFGLPILEALYAKIPVITTSFSSLPEAGDGGAYYIQSTEPQSIATAMETVLSDSSYQKQLIESGQKHLLNFDAKVISEQWIDLYQKVENS
ncbi:MAG: glycosyltransferase family 1 protein [Bacteroidota bacterium]